MSIESVENRYHVNYQTAKGLNRTLYGQTDNASRDAQLGDKLTHIAGNACLHGSDASSNQGGYTNNRFVFTDIGLYPPYAGHTQLLVFLNGNIQFYSATAGAGDYNTSFDEGEDASTATRSEPTKAGSYIQFNSSLNDEDEVIIIVL